MLNTLKTLTCLYNSYRIGVQNHIEESFMLKKLGLGLAVMMLSAVAIGATSDAVKEDKEFPLDYNPLSHVIGYKDTQNGEGFPPALTEITSAFGKRETVEVAVPQMVSFNVKDTLKNNIKVKVMDKVNVYTIPTKDSEIIEFNSNKYKVSYTVGVGYFYGAEVVLKYDPKFPVEDQEAFLNDKVLRYLEYNNFVEVKKWMGFVKNNVYTRGDITVVVTSEHQGRNNGVVVTVFDEEINKEVGSLFDTTISKDIKSNFKEVDSFLK